MGNSKISPITRDKLWLNLYCNRETDNIQGTVCNYGLPKFWHQSNEHKNSLFLQAYRLACLCIDTKRLKNIYQQEHGFQIAESVIQAKSSSQAVV